MSCDCESPSFYHEQDRTARVEHKCCECRRVIAIGSRYTEVRGIWAREWSVFRTCPRCERVRVALWRDDKENRCIPLGGLREALRQRIYDRHRWAKDWATFHDSPRGTDNKQWRENS